MSQSKKENELRIMVQSKYEQLVKEHGILFDRFSITMDEMDREEVRKKQRLVVFVLAPLLVTLLMAALYFTWEGFSSGAWVLAFIGIVVIAAVISFFRYEDILKNNSKEILKGVLTNKENDADDDEYNFEISNKETINVGRSNFKKFSVGDIVEIEVLGRDSLGLRTIVTRLGTIFDDRIKRFEERGK
jgi:hypothetical protein